MGQIRLLLVFLWMSLTVATSATSASAQTVPGTSSQLQYNWSQRYYAKLAGQNALLFAREMKNSKLAFADIDDDGDQDIFVGQANGELAFFENKGSQTKPNFILVTQEYQAIFEQRRQVKRVLVRNKISVGRRSAPALTDIDFDGDLDLFIGNGSGNIWFFENIGNNLLPEFKLVSARYEGINVGRNAVPVFADVNLKRKIDLLIGTVEGKVYLLLNQGTRRKASFSKSKAEKVVEFELETHASPALTDWDGDGDLDLLVGMKNGTISLFKNRGDRFFPDWKLTTDNFLLVDIGGESSPVFVDFDHDGDDDMVVGSANPTVSLFENRIQGKQRILWNISSNIFNFNKFVISGQRASIATGDVDQDGDLDLIVGEKNGNLNYYTNHGTPSEPDWSLVTEELIYITGMENSAPAFGDIDGDGDLDILVGDKQGLLAFIENIGTPKKPKWVLKDKTYFQIDVGSNSVPRLIDIDKDGDLDLMMGNYTGRVILYLNKGTKNAPLFSIESTRFASAKITRNSVPALFDWNQDTNVDLILGGADGKLVTYFSPADGEQGQLNWDMSDKLFTGFELDGLSHPLFSDINGDKVQDLLVGNSEGDFLLYINKGTGVDPSALQIVVDNSIDQKSGSLVVESVEGPIELDIAEATTEGDAAEDEYQTIDSFMEDEGFKKIVIAPKFSKSSSPLIKNRTIKKSSPTFGDLDADGDFDLLVGSDNGKVYYYQNQGTEDNWDFQLLTEDYLHTAGKITNSTPQLIDLDQDGDLDIILGSGLGRLSYYNNKGTTEEPNFVLEPDFFKQLWLGKNAKPTVLDLNGDRILDLLVGTLNGRLTYVSNESNRFLIRRRDYQGIDIGIGSTPSFVDLNNDDVPDLMIGSDRGTIHFYKRDPSNPEGLWAENTAISGQITPPKGSNPTLADLDHDGDPDLITGSDAGHVLIYKNDAIVRSAVEESVPTAIEE